MGEKTVRIDLTCRGVRICSLCPIDYMEKDALKMPVDTLNHVLKSFRFLPNTNLFKVVGTIITANDTLVAEGIIEEKVN